MTNIKSRDQRKILARAVVPGLEMEYRERIAFPSMYIHIHPNMLSILTPMRTNTFALSPDPRPRLWIPYL